MEELFGTDGIRGKAGQFPIIPKLAFSAGLAFGQRNRGKRILIGRDTRESGPNLAHAVYAGLSQGGAIPVQGGIIPTPVLAFTVSALDFSGGVMITASHNPYTDNGFKFFTETGRKLSDTEQSILEKKILDPDTSQNRTGKFGDKGIEPTAGENFIAPYLNRLLSIIHPDHIRLRLPIDCANGAAVPMLRYLNQKLRTPIPLLNISPDGRNINRDCGAAQAEKMRKNSAALDGDGDRILFKDNNGRLITGDHLLLLLAETLGPDAIVGTVMTNQAVAVFCGEHNISFYRSKVGDRFVREKMDAHRAHLGGETSGHIILDTLNMTGDGFAIYLQVLAILDKQNLSLADIFNRYPMMPQTLLNIPVSEKPALETIPGFTRILEKTGKKLGSSGRIFPRYSGTENLLRILIESPSDKMNEEIASQLSDFFQNRRTQ